MAAEKRQTPNPSNDYYPPRRCDHSFVIFPDGSACRKCLRIWLLDHVE